MKNIRSYGYLCLLICCLLITPVFIPVYAQTSQSEGETEGEPTPSMIVKNIVTVSPQYGFYDSLVDRSEITVKVQFGEQIVDNIKIFRIFLQRSPTGLRIEPHDSNSTISFYNKFYDLLEISVPSSTKNASIYITMELDGSTVLGRNSVSIPYIPVYTNTSPYNVTSYIVSAKSIPDVVFTDFSGLTPLKTESPGGVSYDLVNPSGGITLLYEGSNRLFYTSVFLIVVFLLLVFGKIFGRILIRLSRSISLLFSRVSSHPYLRVSSRVSDRMLVFYIILSIFMIGFSLAVGPDPTPRVYLSATPQTASILGPIVTSAGFSYLTPATGGNQFDVMASLGSYRAAVVADYLPGYSGEQALPGLGSLQHIFIIRQYAPSTFITTARELWGVSVRIVDDPTQLGAALQEVEGVQNALGLTISSSFFQVGLAIMGICSLLLAFLAMAFLASRLVEAGSSSRSGIAEAIAFSVMMFFFSQMVYMVSAVLLEVPLGLHAGISGMESAVGVLGFGGGSRPRMVACMLGFVFGAVATKEGRLKVELKGFIALLGVIVFILVAPSNVGVFLHELILAFTTSTQAPAGSTVNLVKGYIGNVGEVWTTDWSSSYFMQRGIPLFYASVIAFSLYPRVRKVTATLLLLIGSFAAANGFLRIADQVPVKGIASIPPGLILGFAVIPLILVLDRVEKSLSLKLGRIA
jgi:hypothetical protein